MASMDSRQSTELPRQTALSLWVLQQRAGWHSEQGGSRASGRCWGRPGRPADARAHLLPLPPGPRWQHQPVAEDEHWTFSGSPANRFLNKEAFAKLSSGEALGRKAMLSFYGKSGLGRQSIFLRVSS